MLIKTTGGFVQLHGEATIVGPAMGHEPANATPARSGSRKTAAQRLYLMKMPLARGASKV